MPIDASGYWYPDLCPKQLEVYNCRKRYTLVSGPKKCVSGRTRLLNPATGKATTISELCQSKIHPLVMTLDGPVPADVPFYKGIAELFRVELSSGESFEATAQHQVLSESGYVAVESLRIGSRLLGYGLSQHQTTSGSDQKAHRGGDLRLTDKGEGSRCDCPTCFRSRGEQSQTEEAPDRDSQPSPADAREHSDMPDDGPLDAPAYKPERIHWHPQFDHPCSADVQHQPVETSGTLPQSLRASETPSAESGSCQQPQLSESESLIQPPFGLRDLDCDRMQSFDLPCGHLEVRINSVKSITSIGIDLFYDLHVPGPNHYFAEGAIHHNSGKTLVNMHRLVRHAYDTPGARIGMFAKTVKNAKAGGIWNDIVDIAMPEWINAKVTKFTSRKSDGTYGVKQDPQSRMMYFRMKNAVGGNSEFQLHSIDNENEVESIAKGTRFSCFYFAELSNFRKRLVFDITSDQLRMPGMPFEDHMWLADTNPADDGPDSWIYQLWYKLREKPNPDAAERFMLKHLHLIQIMIEDNTYLTDEEKADLYARFSHDPDLAARYLEGKWVRAVEGALFSAQFKPDIHVIGDCSPMDEREWEVILPSERCHTLISGWDLGDRFHSSHIIEPIVTGEGEGVTYCVLDEVNHLDPDTNVGVNEFVEAFMDRYLFWMKVAGTEPDWRHWADAAALLNFRASAETYDKNLIYKYSDERVLVQAAPKFPGSVQKRVNMLRIMLHERRIMISARCFQTIDMFKALKKGTGARVVAESKFRHVFDSLSYALAGEEPQMLMDEILDGQKEEGRLVSVALTR